MKADFANDLVPYFTGQSSGHRLSEGSYNSYQVAPHAGLWGSVACSCGNWWESFSFSKTKEVPKRYVARWQDHLRAQAADPLEILLVGTIQTKRLFREVLVVPPTYPDLQRYVDGSNGRRKYKSPFPNGWAAIQRSRPVVTKAPDRWTTFGVFSYGGMRSPEKAVALAQRRLLQAQARGEKVTFSQQGQPLTPGDVQPVRMPASYGVTALMSDVDEAVESDDLERILRVLNEVDEAIASVALLEGAREKIRTRLLRPA